MGLEAKCQGRWRGGSGEIKALLETHELIIRGAFKGRFPIADLRDVRVDGRDLCFKVAGNQIALALGVDFAMRWAKKIATPPPSLAKKLGVGPSSKVLVIGLLDEPALREAVDGNTAARVDEAQLSLAIVKDEKMLDNALRAHQTLPSERPIWIVYQKGAHAVFGEGAVRQRMREAGYRDNKVSAVSDGLSAMRYARPSGKG
jgi:hypothetical protein